MASPRIEVPESTHSNLSRKSRVDSRILHLRENEIIVGRDATASARIESAEISRRHAKLSRDPRNPDSWTITDLKSTNHSFVNGTELPRDQPVKLRLGDVISFGPPDKSEYVYVFSCEKICGVTYYLLRPRDMETRSNLARLQRINAQLNGEYSGSGTGDAGSRSGNNPTSPLDSRQDNRLSGRSSNQSSNRRARSDESQAGPIRESRANVRNVWQVKPHPSSSRDEPIMVDHDRNKESEIKLRKKIEEQEAKFERLRQEMQQKLSESESLLTQKERELEEMRRQLAIEKEEMEAKRLETERAKKEKIKAEKRKKSESRDISSKKPKLTDPDPSPSTSSILKDLEAKRQFEDALDMELMCTICQEMFVEPVNLSCSHTFCLYCISTWADKKPSKECPICRKNFRSTPKNLVVGNIIDFMVQKMEQSDKQARESLVAERKQKLSELNQARTSPTWAFDTSRESSDDDSMTLGGTYSDGPLDDGSQVSIIFPFSIRSSDDDDDDDHDEIFSLSDDGIREEDLWDQGPPEYDVEEDPTQNGEEHGGDLTLDQNSDHESDDNEYEDQDDPEEVSSDDPDAFQDDDSWLHSGGGLEPLEITTPEPNGEEDEDEGSDDGNSIESFYPQDDEDSYHGFDHESEEDEERDADEPNSAHNDIDEFNISNPLDNPADDPDYNNDENYSEVGSDMSFDYASDASEYNSDSDVY